MRTHYFLVEIDKKILKFIRKNKHARISRKILRGTKSYGGRGTDPTRH